VTKDLLPEFGAERVRDTPISEAGFIGAAIGMAMTGLRPVVEIMWADFTFVAMDQILNQAAKLRYMSGGQVKIPLVIRTQQGGGRGNGAQHSQSLEVLFAYIPGLKVVLPATPRDAKGLLKASLRQDNPVIFLEHKLLYQTTGDVSEDDFVIPLGQAEVVVPGSDLTIVSWSRTLLHAVDAACMLRDDGLHAEVINLRTLVPCDMETIYRSVSKTNRLVVAHEAHLSFGPGAEIVARVQEQAFGYLDAPILRVATPDIPIPYSKPVEAQVLPAAATIVAAARTIVGRE
jgi:pyruvate dehydrogenase E1 component beta subunit